MYYFLYFLHQKINHETIQTFYIIEYTEHIGKHQLIHFYISSNSETSESSELTMVPFPDWAVLALVLGRQRFRPAIWRLGSLPYPFVRFVKPTCTENEQYRIYHSCFRLLISETIQTNIIISVYTTLLV